MNAANFFLIFSWIFWLGFLSDFFLSNYVYTCVEGCEGRAGWRGLEGVTIDLCVELVHTST